MDFILLGISLEGVIHVIGIDTPKLVYILTISIIKFHLIVKSMTEFGNKNRGEKICYIIID